MECGSENSSGEEKLLKLLKIKGTERGTISPNEQVF